MLNELILRLIRLYTFYSPFRKGKYRLYEFVLNKMNNLPDNLVVKTRDGRKLNVNLANKMYDTVFFLGEYERAVTEIISRVVSKSDICIDVGANYGWYATFLSELGVKQVHAFEPVPPTFGELEANFKLAGMPENLMIKNLALGNAEKKIELHIFDDVPNGHASISTQGKQNYKTFQAEMIQLDRYVKKNDIGQVDFIKIDVEGAEMSVLEGAQSLFKQIKPPVLMIEMALETSRHFGYLPQDLLLFIKSRADYEFYAVDESSVLLKKIERFSTEDIGANVLCIPANFDTEKLKEFILNE